MVQRVNITLSDNLHERLQAVKDRFNISGVCQDAIEQKIIQKELLLKETADMESTIERLKMEKKSFNKKYYDMGYEEAMANVKSMDYATFLEVEHYCHLNIEDQNSDCDNIFNRTLDSTKHLQHDTLFDGSQFVDGWLDAVMEFWNAIKDDVYDS